MELQLYDQMARLEAVHFWFRARQRILRELLNKKLPQNGTEKKVILDAGCGTGGNMDWLAEFGKVYAFDREKIACASAKNKNHGSIVCASLDAALPFRKKSFDLITCLDVLEHIDNEVDVLNKFNDVMKDDGRLLLTVPAFPHLWSHHDVSHQHRRRYYLSQLEELLRKSRFKLIYISYFNTFLYPLIAGTRLLKKVINTEQEDLRLPAPWVNECLYHIFAAERHWLGQGRFPFGVSLVAMATPEA